MYTVYSITNRLTGKCYVGITKNIHRRFELHRYYLNVGRHPNEGLQVDWSLHGSDNFSFEILATGLKKQSASIRELYFINGRDTYNERRKGQTIEATYYSNNKAPKLSRQQVKEILSLKGKLFGWQIAQKFDISPSTVTKVFHNRYPVKA